MVAAGPNRWLLRDTGKPGAQIASPSRFCSGRATSKRSFHLAPFHTFTRADG